jgi:hypothetical protein
MRCARCDRLAYPLVLGRAPDGNLVFGWCRSCLDEEGCALVESAPAPITVKRREPIGRKLRRIRRTIRRLARRPRAARSMEASRRLATIGVSGLMAAWALVLAFVGGFKLIAHGDPKGPMLLTGAGVMAIISLIVWVSLIGRSPGSGVVWKVVQVASAVVAFGTLAWGVLRNDPSKAPRIVAISGAALAVSWMARRIELKKRADRPHKTETIGKS